MKVVINRCFGGFGLSKIAESRLTIPEGGWFGGIARDDPQLIQVVEELGRAANGDHADLKIVEIPDGTQYTIEEYDGLEHVAEVHETWS